MEFILATHEESRIRRCAPTVPRDTVETTIKRNFDVVDPAIHTQRVGHTGRRRRFLIERVEIVYLSKNGAPLQRSYVNARGRSVLADGSVSSRSSGYAHWWRHDQLPPDINVLAALQDKAVGC